MDNINYLHLIEVKYIAPTNSRGSRVGLRSLRFGTRVIISFDYQHRNIDDMAIDYLLKRDVIARNKHNQHLIGKAEDEKRDLYYLILDAGDSHTFKDIK